LAESFEAQLIGHFNCWQEYQKPIFNITLATKAKKINQTFCVYQIALQTFN